MILARSRLQNGQMIMDNANSVTGITDDSLDNATVSVGPGETVNITLRFFNPDKTQPLPFDIGQAITTVSISHAIDTGGTQPPVAASHLLIVTTSLPAGVAGSAYDQFVQGAGGSQPYTWSVSQGSLPIGLTLNPATGEISGTIDPTSASIYNFTVQLSDSATPRRVQTQALSIQVSRVALAITGLAALGPVSASVKPGDTITVTATVGNGGSPADSVIAGINLTATGTASANCGPPSPASVNLPNGVQQTFTFTCTNVTGIGTLSFAVTITAIDHASGAGISISPATSNLITVLSSSPQVAVTATSGGVNYVSGVWTNHDVIVTFTCTPSVGAPVIKTITVVSEGANQTVTTTCTDLAGNQATATFSGIDIDKTPPLIAATATAGGQPYSGSVTSQTVIVTFTCTDPGGSGVTVPSQQQSFAGDGLGQKATGTCTDLAGNTSTTSYSPINIVKTPPQLTVVLTAAGSPYAPGSWTNQGVTVLFKCTPASGIGVQFLTPSTTVSNEGGNQFVGGSCTDIAGNTASLQAGPINIDKTPPQISGQATPAIPATGWYRGQVSVAFTCSDSLSGVAAGYPQGNTLISSDTAGSLVNGTCRDQAGNVASATVGPIRIDTQPPVMQLLSISGINAAGWNKGPTAVTWTCVDTGSGPVAPKVSQTMTASGTASATCKDVAGNTTTATQAVQIDSTAPGITFNSPLNNVAYPQGSVVAASYSCSDGGSGIASCTGTIPNGQNLNTNTPGTYSFTVTAVDVAGNQTRITRSYSVVAP